MTAVRRSPGFRSVLGGLRVALHVSFAVLLAVGVLRVLVSPVEGAAEHALRWLAVAAAAVLAGLYLAGTLVEKRAADGRPTPRFPDPSRWELPWLAGVTALWVLLLALHPDFSWLAFPLFFLHLHVLPRPAGYASVAALAAVVAAAQWFHAGTLHLAMVLGPLFGAVFAAVVSAAYRALYTEGQRQRQALEELLRTRADLAAAQHESGVLAERARLARDIHDTLAQGLSSIVLVSRAADAALAAGQADAARAHLATVEATAAENLAEARRFVRGDGPSATGLSGAAGLSGATAPSLPESLRALCRGTEERASHSLRPLLDCRFELVGEPVPLPARHATALLRAAQASLANVLAHAHASTAVVTLGFAGRSVTLDVYDDGAGFNAAAALGADGPRPDGTGFGLLGLRERIEALDGALAVESGPGEGTVVAIRLPVPEGDGRG